MRREVENQIITPELRDKMMNHYVSMRERKVDMAEKLLGYNDDELVRIFTNTLLELVDIDGTIKKPYANWKYWNRGLYFEYRLSPLYLWFSDKYGYISDIHDFIYKIVYAERPYPFNDYELEGRDNLFKWAQINQYE